MKALPEEIFSSSSFIRVFYGIFFGSTCDTSADILVLVMSPFLSGYDCAGSWLVQPHLVVARVWAG